MKGKHKAIGADTTLATQKNYINGAYVDNRDGATFETRHPGNDQRICEVEIAGDSEVDAAVQAAKAAFKSWSETPAVERGAILRRAGEILRERNQALAELETLDTGKPISEMETVYPFEDEVGDFPPGCAEATTSSPIPCSTRTAARRR